VIVLDASAVVALLNRESGFESIAARMVHERVRYISPVSSVEAVMALARTHRDPGQTLDAFLAQESISVLPTDLEQTIWARRAFSTYGKRGHPARLNLGDCFSYAAAKALNAPLLYVGGNFAQTDIHTA
jgi:ribonuclease VapC